MWRAAVLVALVGCTAKSAPNVVALRGQPVPPVQMIEVDRLANQALVCQGRIVQVVLSKWEVEGDTLVYSALASSRSTT
jgi:hypothetical protein